MRILLVGEYSRLHNTLKEGLLALNHEVTIIGDGDGFKNFPVDLTIKPIFSEKKIISFFRKMIYKITKNDFASLERGIRFWYHLSKLKNYDIVQLINEKPIKTIPFFERWLLKKLFNQNKNVFLLSCGIDVISLRYMLNKQFRYSLMDPFFKSARYKPEYDYIMAYTKKEHLKTHEFVIENCAGIIASDFDYVLPLTEHPKFLGLVPNPVKPPEGKNNTDSYLNGPVKILLGINRSTYTKKGIIFFEQALEIINQKYSDEKISIKKVENLPYNTYINELKDTHVLLDQVYAYDQGYNALEAMAYGKVVFTGAEEEFLEYYNLKKDEVCINALPDVDYLVNKLSHLIENPNEIATISVQAQSFIEREHHYIKIAGKYVEKWKNKEA